MLFSDLARALQQVVIKQNQDAGYEGDQGHLFPGDAHPNRLLVKPQEFTDHPKGVGADPECDGQVVCQLGGNVSGAPADHDRNGEGGNDHRDSKFFPKQTPADVLQKPKHNVHVFHPAKARRYGIK